MSESTERQVQRLLDMLAAGTVDPDLASRAIAALDRKSGPKQGQPKTAQ